MRIFFNLIFLFLFLSNPIFAVITVKDSIKESASVILEQTFYSNGQEIAKRTFNSNGFLLRVTGKIPDGLVKKINDRGRTEWEVFFKNNQPQGWAKGYYNNGTLKEEFFYQNGLKEGKARTFYENGQVEWECTYRRDLKDGFETQYWRGTNAPNYQILWRNNYEISQQYYTLDGKILYSFGSTARSSPSTRITKTTKRTATHIQHQIKRKVR
jgi:antitoxin component YwqK of YwqJK toxin-antitoxin module